MRFFFFCLLIVLIASCEQKKDVFEQIHYPTDNPLDQSIAVFGEKLFFDQRLSSDNLISCASCHKPELAFADSVGISPGVEGRLGFRNAPTLFNVAYKSSLMLDGAVPNLEMQAIVPIQDHNEMAMSMRDLVTKLSQIKEYQEFSQQLFNRDLDAYVITRALANYERTLISNNSRFDSFYYKNENDALTESEKKGWKLFKEKGCIECHSLPHFSNHSIMSSGFAIDINDLGRFRITSDSADIGKFVVPTLRNIALTKPYLHNGSYSSLEKVIKDHYQAKRIRSQNRINLDIDREEVFLLVQFLNTLTNR